MWILTLDPITLAIAAGVAIVVVLDAWKRFEDWKCRLNWLKAGSSLRGSGRGVEV
jgi:hypothetical protein